MSVVPYSAYAPLRMTGGEGMLRMTGEKGQNDKVRGINANYFLLIASQTIRTVTSAGFTPYILPA
jgi:hypothetical protein